MNCVGHSNIDIVSHHGFLGFGIVARRPCFAFVYFMGALASSPEIAYEKYGNYNVAWEIRNDVSAGVYLVNNPAYRLTERQVSEIQNLASIRDSLPAGAIKFTNLVQESLINMRHPAWEPVRKMAAQLLESLRSVTASNERYFSKANKGSF